jgi:high-affinity K+ transport system ATPase subunit B
MMNFASVSETVAKVYAVDDIIVNGCVLVFLMAFVIMNFFTVYALEYSINVTFKVCAILTTIGAWCRYAGIKYTENFYYLMIG